MEARERSGMNSSAQEIEQLSRREFEVLDHIQLGLTNRQIAQRLFVSHNTVNKHVHQVLRKLNVSNRVQAAIYRRDVGLLARGATD
jgi:DNA-binding NarL/FixJ family response regulator